MEFEKNIKTVLIIIIVIFCTWSAFTHHRYLDDKMEVSKNELIKEKYENIKLTPIKRRSNNRHYVCFYKYSLFLNWAGGKSEITVVEFEAEKNGNKVKGYVCTHFFNQLVKIYRDDEFNWIGDNNEKVE